MNKFISSIIVTLSFIFVLVTELKASDICEKEEKYSQTWYYNNCDGNILQSTDQKPIKSHLKQNPNVGYPYNSDEIPEDANPDYKILKHYLKKSINSNQWGNRGIFKIKKTKNFKKFEFDLRIDKNVIEQLNETALLSYLEYVDGKIVVDEITPKDRFGKIFKNKSKHPSHSVGKSIISYITGHAICKGYISGINHKLNDWPILEKTLFYNQPLINPLNMASGGYKIIKSKGGGEFINSNRWVNDPSIQSIMENEFKDSKPAKSKYSYSNLDTNLVASYVLYKMGHKNFKEMLNEIFADKVGIEYDMIIKKQRRAKKNETTLTYSMHITRYDFLRIAVAMLDDWNNNTCEGKYLKSLYENRIDKGFRPKDNTKGMSNSNHYAGQFYVGMSGKGDVPIFIMSGHGGQNIVIDFENKKITAILAIHRNYDWMKLVHSKF